jgi:hypothetical protein
LNIDREERKLSLGLKQLTADPWADIETRYPHGSKHTATVRSMTNFGLFVELEPGIDGLVHISDLSWTRKFSHPAEFTKVGEKIDVVVLDLDKENRRLSLGHKQLEEDPWDTFSSIFFEGSLHQGVLHHIDDKGATVGLPYGVEAYVPKKFLAKADRSQPKVDETLEFKVKEFDKSNRKIILSHSDIWRDEERGKQIAEEQSKMSEEEKMKKDVKKVKSSVEKSTIGDELDILQQLKNQMEEADKVKQKEAMDEMDKKSKSKKATDGTEANDETAVDEAAPVTEKKKAAKAKATHETAEEEHVASTEHAAEHKKAAKAKATHETAKEEPEASTEHSGEPKKAAKAKATDETDEGEHVASAEHTEKKKADKAKATHETAEEEPEASAEHAAEKKKTVKAKAKTENSDEETAETTDEHAPKAEKKAPKKKKAGSDEEVEEEE